VLAGRQLEALVPFNGAEVLYAVSPRGAVLLKPAADLTAAETALVATDKRKEEKLRVPVDRVDLTATRVLDLRALRAADSGRLCGPKAANPGQLKSLFPDNVVEGVVIPFGIFRAHLDQTVPGEMPFLPGFVEDLESSFAAAVGAPLGEQPVFIRSDTNMEDLRDFTGAGLNLTLFNIRDRETVLQGIRQVWASPYSERSFRWRQRYLLNPEDVYPSILVLPAVNVDKSGVMITTGVSSGAPGDNTVAFNRGVAGAVEGQVAETYLLRADGRDEPLSPSRETCYTALPVAGGLAKRPFVLAERILDESDRQTLRRMSATIRERMAPIVEGPLDVELGLLDGRVYCVSLMSNVLRRNSAVEHQTLATYIDRILGR
jgi:hypothetical protein